MRARTLRIPVCLAAAAAFLAVGQPRGEARWLAGQSGQSTSANPSSEGGPPAKQPGEKAKPAAPNTAKKSNQKLVKGMKLSGSQNLRAAPLTQGEGGGYSSSMDAPASGPGNNAVDKGIVQGLLLNPDQWRVGPHGLIERLNQEGKWIAESSGVKTDLNAVSFRNRWVGWAVGEQGTVLRSEDSGQTWETVPFPGHDDLLHVRATDWKSAQVTTGDGKTLATSDGGKTWVPARSQR